jgi:hypothetical protein
MGICKDRECRAAFRRHRASGHEWRMNMKKKTALNGKIAAKPPRIIKAADLVKMTDLELEHLESEDVTMAFEDIGPETAMRYLERNINNRKIRQRVVDRIARDIKHGNWRVTHQGIAFNIDGDLIDGQHRLWAIVESGCTVRVMVTRGLARNANEAIDQTLNRQVTDILHYQGVSATMSELAVAKIIMSPKHVGWSRAETIDAYLKHQTAISAVFRMFPHHKKRITLACVLGGMCRAWYSQDRARLARFAEVLYDGVASEEEKVIMILRDFLQTLKSTSGMSLNAEIYGKTERALMAYLTGDRISKLFVAASELFPLPDEKDKAESVFDEITQKSI